MRHFDRTVVYSRGDDVILKSNAIPTIFENNVESANDEKKGEKIPIEKNGTEDLQKRIQELENQICVMQIQHDVQIQHEKVKSKHIVQSQATRCKVLQKELTKKESRMVKMEELIEELKGHHFISPGDEKFLDVSLDLTFFD